MGEVFPYQAAIPGEMIHFFGATQPGVLTSDPQVLVARLRERKLNTQYVREYFIPYRMTPDRMEQIKTELSPAANTPVNRDFAPVAYAFDVVLWSTEFKSGYADWFRAAARVSFARLSAALVALLLICTSVLGFLPGREVRQRAAAGSCVAATGFTLMTLQIFLLLGFQAVYGYVYAELAILIALFMAGIAPGSWLAMRQAESADGWTLAKAQLLFAFAVPALLLAVSAIGSSVSAAATWIVAQIVFPALALLAGLLGGYLFVVAAGIFLRERSGRAGLGVFYALDLLGGCAGALALSTFLIPVFGFWKTAWLVAAVNIVALVLAIRMGFRRPYGTRLDPGH